MDDLSDGMVNSMLAQCFGAVGIRGDGGWHWHTDGRGIPRNQIIHDFYVVQVAHEGKSWIWAHRTKGEAEAVAKGMKANKIKNVRLKHAHIEWTDLTV